VGPLDSEWAASSAAPAIAASVTELEHQLDGEQRGTDVDQGEDLELANQEVASNPPPSDVSRFSRSLARRSAWSSGSHSPSAIEFAGAPSHSHSSTSSSEI
jgi:hypothetical protein